MMKIETIDQPCPECGAIQVSYRLIGHLETKSCPQCGWRQHGTFIPGSEIESNFSEPEWVRVHIEWTGATPTTDELRVARRMFDKFATTSLSDLVKSAATSPRLEVGVFAKAYAERLREQAGARGLKLVSCDVAGE